MPQSLKHLSSDHLNLDHSPFEITHFLYLFNKLLLSHVIFLLWFLSLHQQFIQRLVFLLSFLSYLCCLTVTSLWFSLSVALLLWKLHSRKYIVEYHISNIYQACLQSDGIYLLNVGLFMFLLVSCRSFIVSLGKKQNKTRHPQCAVWYTVVKQPV